MEIKKHKVQAEIKIENQNSTIEKINSKNDKHNFLINKALGNLNVIIAEYYKKDDALYFRFSIAAAKFQHLNNSNEPAKVNLDACYQISLKPNFNQIVKSAVEKEKNAIDETLNELCNSKDNEIKRVSLSIYCKYIEEMNKPEEKNKAQ